MAIQTHIIDKQIIELNIPQREGAYEMQQEISLTYRDHILPRLEELFDQLVDKDTVIRLDSLELELGTLDPQQLSFRFVEQFLQQAEQVLRKKMIEMEVNVRPEMTKVSTQNSLLEAWQFFLENGYLPWWEKQNLKEWEQNILSALEKKPALLVLLHPQIEANPIILKRLITQFSNTFLYQLLSFLPVIAHQTTLLKDIKTIYENLKTPEHKDIRQLFWQVIFEKSLQSQSPSSLRQNIIIKLYKSLIKKSIKVHETFLQYFQPLLGESFQNTFSKLEKIIQEQDKLNLSEKSFMVSSQDTKEAPSKKNVLDNKSIHIFNAGLVLLHPFLPTLFESQKWIENSVFVDENAQHKAIHMTQYLVSGEYNLPEYQLVLNKILCGLPIEEIAERQLDLSDENKIEAEHLLETVIRHWKVLKNTTPDGLRYNFLKREGKLVYENNSWHLQVATKTLDMLLDRLPWGMSKIKLPWMPEMLSVEWGT